MFVPFSASALAGAVAAEKNEIAPSCAVNPAANAFKITVDVSVTYGNGSHHGVKVYRVHAKGAN